MRKIIFTFLILFMFVSTAHSTDIGGDADVYGGLTTDVGSIGSGKGDSTINGTLDVTGAFGAPAITGTSFIIGLNTLDTAEWGYLDGLNQSVGTGDGVTFTTISGTGVTGTSFIIGANTLDTNEWAFIDGLDQSVSQASAVTFTTIGGTAITGTSFVIGGNTLDTNEWGYLDGQDQAVHSDSNVTFGTIGGTAITGTSLSAGSGTIDGGDITGTNVNTTNASMITDGTITGTSLTVGAGAIDGGDITGTNVNTTNASMITDGTVTGVSYDIGGDSLTTTEWGFLDDINQSVSTTDNVTFAKITGTGELTLSGASDRITNEETGEYIDMATDGQITFNGDNATDLSFDVWNDDNLADGPDIFSASSTEVGIRDIAVVNGLRVEEGADNDVWQTRIEGWQSAVDTGNNTGIVMGYWYETTTIDSGTDWEWAGAPANTNYYSPFTKTAGSDEFLLLEDAALITFVALDDYCNATTLTAGQWTYDPTNGLCVRPTGDVDPDTLSYEVTQEDFGERFYSDGSAIQFLPGITFQGTMNILSATPALNFGDTDTANAFGAITSSDGNQIIASDTLNTQSGSEIIFNVDSSGNPLYTPIEAMSIDENSVDLATGMDLIITDMAGGGVDDVCVDNNGLVYSSDTACVGGGSESTTVSDTAEVDLTLTTFDITADLKDDSIVEARLDISNAPTDAYILQYKDATDKLTWIANTGGGTVTSSGTPLVNRLPYFTTDTNITGTTNATLDSAGNLAAISYSSVGATDTLINAQTDQGITLKLGKANGTSFFQVTNSSDASGMAFSDDGKLTVLGMTAPVFANNKVMFTDTSGWLTTTPITSGDGVFWNRSGTVLSPVTGTDTIEGVEGTDIETTGGTEGQVLTVAAGDLTTEWAAAGAGGELTTVSDTTEVNLTLSTYDITADLIDDTIAEVRLDISNTPTDGYILQYKDVTDKLTWVANTGGVDTSGSPLVNYMTYFSDLDTITGTANATVDSSGNIVAAGDVTVGGAGSDTLITLSNSTTITAVSTGTIGMTGLVQFIGGTNNCIIEVDDDGTCDGTGTALVVNNSIALCAVCAAN